MDIAADLVEKLLNLNLSINIQTLDLPVEQPLARRRWVSPL